MRSTNQSNFDYQYCFLLSGPEPQRTILENQILSIVTPLSGSIILVRGLPATLDSMDAPNHLKVLNHVSTEKLAAILTASELIICRSGYTSVMELIGLHKKALLIPTPGQTEQVYLAEKLQSEQRFFMSKQEGMHLLSAIEAAKAFPVQYAEISLFSTKVLEALLLEI
jgi:UDP-N-acetylglucosamine transferase subunit ALG13